MELLELFREFGSNMGLKLVIVGDGSLRGRVIEFILRNSLSNFVYYIGPIENKKKLYSLYKNALALVMPSILVENAPLVALEAFSVGCPVIARNVAGLPEIVKKIDERLIFEDLSELRNTLLTFSKNKFPSEKITRVYKENFSPEVYLGKYLAMIHGLGHQLSFED
jgi:glycosyltransferase involved in cell wall biosynthesis